MSDTNATEQMDASGAQVHEISIDAKHLVTLTFPGGTSSKRASHTIQSMRRLLDEWWTSRQPFLVVGLLDGLELRFHRKETEEDAG
jgi:hypothetical protein